MTIPPNHGISHAAYFLPPGRMSIEEWGDLTGQPPQIVEALQASGLGYFHCADGMPVEELCAGAIQRLLTESALDPTDVDAVLYFHTTQTSIMAPPASLPARLAQRFGFSRAVAFSVSQQNCVSFLSALRVIGNMMAADPTWQTVLVVGADVCDYAPLRNIEAIGMHSDGAAAAIVSRNATRNRVVSTVFVTYGEHHRGVRSPPDLTQQFNNMYYLSTHRIISRLLRENNMNASDIRLLLPHNVNRTGWSRILRSLKLDESNFYGTNIFKKSHVYGCDGIINIVDSISESFIGNSDNYIVYSMGYGGCFGAALIKH